MKRNPLKSSQQSRLGSYQSPKYESRISKDDKELQKSKLNETQGEQLSPQRLLRGIKKIRNKGILSLGEHGNTNVVIDTDSELSYDEKQKKPSEVKLKKGTTKLLVSKMEQGQLDSTRKSLMNLKSQRREKLSNFIVKPEEKYYDSPGMNIYGTGSGSISLNRDYNIRIPGSLSRNKKKKDFAITSNRFAYGNEGQEQENEELISQSFINPLRERNIRQRQQGNLEIFVSPDVKITTNIKTPNLSYINSPSYNYISGNQNYRNINIQATPTYDKNKYYFGSSEGQQATTGGNIPSSGSNNQLTTNNFLYTVSSIMDNEGTPLSTYKPINYSLSPKSPSGGKVDLNLNPYQEDLRKKYYAIYKKKLLKLF